jgi:hypothetical protein
MAIVDSKEPSRPSLSAPANRTDSLLGNRQEPAGDSVGFLFSRGSDSLRESRRITLGLFGLALLGITLVNIGIYQSSHKQIVERGWEQLATTTTSSAMRSTISSATSSGRRDSSPSSRAWRSGHARR